MAPSVVLKDLTFNWPEGTAVFRGISGAFAAGRTGLVGRNGAGKSTLLKAIAGTIAPTSGHIDAAGTIAYLPQNITADPRATVASLLGIATVIDAIAAVERGDVDQQHFDVIGDDWDVEVRARATLARVGFHDLPLDRPVSTLSGGEVMLLAVTGCRVRRADVTLLDEPTNNLDPTTRRRLYDLVAEWPGALIVVSHDLDLLELMQNTAELHAGHLTFFGGPYSAFLEHLEEQQDAATKTAHAAAHALKAEKRQRQDAEAKLAQRARTANRTQASGGIPKILAGNRASRAQASAGAMRTGLDARVNAAQAAVDAADARVREDEHIHITLPDPVLPAGRRIAELRTAQDAHTIQGPERVAVIGSNGAGKTTLLRHLLDPNDTATSPGGVLHVTDFAYLPQRFDRLDGDQSPVQNVMAVAPGASEGEIRNQLARLLIRGTALDRPVSGLSGGERFRVNLATLLLQQPPAQLLILDEPTNNLDSTSVTQLVEALSGYRGALLVVSHDYRFLASLEPTVILELSRGALKSLPGLPTVRN